ncbi:MAG: hypothetical protein SHS37scaffold537_44 [Phage 68_12]|nr:MAG: hypothetical protein SHS37scaffold537_44 [Phage 68_12]
MTLPELDVELVGGPADGRIYSVSSLLPRIRVPLVEPATTFYKAQADDLYPRSRMQVAEYDRDRISDETHRWRYVYRWTS